MGDSGRLRSIRSKLSLLRLPELRNVLNYMNLHRSGRKQEIIDRIAVALEVGGSSVQHRATCGSCSGSASVTHAVLPPVCAVL